MTNPRSRVVAAVAGVISIGAAAAWAADVTPPASGQDTKIRELEAKVAALESKQQTTLSTSDANATIATVLADAEQRSKLLATSGDAMAGYDNGFYIRTGSFDLRPGLFFQFRHVIDYRQGTSGPKDDEFESGFEVRRMRLEMNGHAFSEKTEYSFVWEANREGGGVTLLDAWVKHMFNDQWGGRIGQFKEPLTHEKLVSAKRQIAVERSVVDNVMGGSFYDRVQGITAIYGGYNKNNPLNAEFGITDGGPSKNTNFTKHGFDFGFVGRVEYKLMGDWSDYRDFTAKNNVGGDLLVVGGGLDWSQAGDGNFLALTVDAHYENKNGLGAYGAIIIQNVDDALTGAGDATNWGIVLQANYLLNPQWEIFGRYDFTKFDAEVVFSPGNSEDTFHELTVGVNYYLGQNGSYMHRAKVTVDLTLLPNGAPAALDALGILDGNGGDTEIMLRTQFQLAI